MKLLEDARGLAVGDVVLVHQQGKDKQTGKPYTWRWFGLVTYVPKYASAVKVMNLARSELGSRAIYLSEDRFEVYHLDDDNEWPDGVWALRTRAILEGRVDLP